MEQLIKPKGNRQCIYIWDRKDLGYQVNPIEQQDWYKKLNLLTQISPAEASTMMYVLFGFTYPQVGQIKDVSATTIGTHMSMIFEKLEGMTELYRTNKLSLGSIVGANMIGSPWFLEVLETAAQQIREAPLTSADTDAIPVITAGMPPNNPPIPYSSSGLDRRKECIIDRTGLPLILFNAAYMYGIADEDTKAPFMFKY